jgi:RNA polymerase sigma-70 factor (ECF subfamily)
MTERDERLAVLAVQGSTAAFTSLVDRYMKRIYNVANRMVNNRDDAMDITQSVFLKVYEKLDTFDPSRKFFSWIYRIAVNESLNHIQRKRWTEDLSKERPSKTPTPEQDFAQKEQSDQLLEVLQTLKDNYRSVIVLKHFYDLSYREIGTILELPEKTVKSRLFTGRQLLKDALISKGYAR